MGDCSVRAARREMRVCTRGAQAAGRGKDGTYEAHPRWPWIYEMGMFRFGKC